MSKTQSGMSSSISNQTQLAPRLCHLVKWTDFDGYGFNLHAERSKPGQYIGRIDDNSPAQFAGLREGDRIVEVNGVNINNENHCQVVERIKSLSNETELLVVDQQTDDWFKEHNLIVKANVESVVKLKTPVPRPICDFADFVLQAENKDNDYSSDIEDSIEIDRTTSAESKVMNEIDKQEENDNVENEDNQVNNKEDYKQRESLPMSPDSGRGNDDERHSDTSLSKVNGSESCLVVRAEINRPPSAISNNRHKFVDNQVVDSNEGDEVVEENNLGRAEIKDNENSADDKIGEINESYVSNKDEDIDDEDEHNLEGPAEQLASDTLVSDENQQTQKVSII